MSRLALGTAQFGFNYGVANQTGQVSSIEAKSMLEIAAKNGINIIDTAIVYGESEASLGFIGVNNFKVVTKLPGISDKCLDVDRWVRDQVKASQNRLGISKIYGLLLHRTIDLLGLNGPSLYQIMKTLKEEGVIEKIGISIYSPDELQELMPIFNFDLVQAPFNPIDRRLLDSNWMMKLKDLDIEIHTRSAFLQGLLLLNKADIPKKFLRWHNLWERWYDWLTKTNISALDASLSFSLSFPEIDCVIVGAESSKQLRQIIYSANNPLGINTPDFLCQDEMLINPANWTIL